MVKIVPVTVTLSLTVTEILATISIHTLTHPLKQHHPISNGFYNHRVLIHLESLQNTKKR